MKNSKIKNIFRIMVFLILQVLIVQKFDIHAEAISIADIPVKGKVTLVDIGAKTCIPCKMMAPILEKLEKEYQGKASIIFLDLTIDKEPAKKFGIRLIPTQIFFDKNGDEVYRHEGFMSEEDIKRQLFKMGVS